MSSIDYTPILLDALTALKKREFANKAPFKARAYDTVLQQMKSLSHPIYSMDDLATIKGMGEKIREKVVEIFETGRLLSAEKAKEQYALDAYDELQGVYGIGPAKASALIKQGILSVAALREAVEKDTTLLNDKQRIGVRYYEDLLQRIPREEMMEHEQLLLRECPFPAELVGSYRRGGSTSGDIDVLLRMPPHPIQKEATSHSQFYRYVQRLKDMGYLEEILALGEHKCMAICRLPSDNTHVYRRLDLLLTPDDEYACALLYFTGSDRFNVAFRQHALQRAYTLNEHRLSPLPLSPLPLSPVDPNREVPLFHEEADLFHFLGLQYTPPHARIDASSLVPIRMSVRRPLLAST